MARSILFPEWCNEQENSNYPFTDNSTMTSGTTAILKSSIIDASIYIVGGGERAHLSNIAVSTGAATFTVTSNTGEIATGNLILGQQLLPLKDKFNRPAGLLVGRDNSLDAFVNWNLGSYDFSPAQASFVATVVIPTPQIGVRGFILETGELFARDVWIVGEQGVFLTKGGNGVIVVDIAGDPAAKARFCEPVVGAEAVRFLKSLNLVGPDEYGDFKIIAGSGEALDTVLRIEPTYNGITIKLIGGALQDAQN